MSKQQQQQQQIKILKDVINDLTKKINDIKQSKICMKCEGTGIVRVGEKDCVICGGTGRHFLNVEDYVDCFQRTRAPLDGTNVNKTQSSTARLPESLESLPSFSEQLAALLHHVDLLHKEVNHLVLRRVCRQCEGNGATKFNKPCRVCENQCGYVTKSNKEVLDQLYGTNREIAAKTVTDSKPCCFCTIQ